jgi:hypothetical protein
MSYKHLAPTELSNSLYKKGGVRVFEEERRGEDDPTEVAGETTAAGTVSGPADTRPVGTGTMVEVADEPAEKPGATASE